MINVWWSEEFFHELVSVFLDVIDLRHGYIRAGSTFEARLYQYVNELAR